MPAEKAGETYSVSLEETGKHWYVWEDPKQGKWKKDDTYVMEKDSSPVF